MARYRPSSYREVYVRQPAWLWLFSGVLLGFLLGLMYAGHFSAPVPISAPPAPAAVTPAAPPAPSPKPPEKPREAVSTPRFEFYDVLPSGELPSPPPATAAAEFPLPEATAQPVQIPVQAGGPQVDPHVPLPPGGVMLQVAAFQKVQDAAGLKAQLQALGFTAQVQQAVVNGGDWYRVRLGPYAGPEQAAAERARLQQSGFQSIVVRY